MGWRTGRPVPQGSWGTWATIEYEGKWKEENCPPPKGTGGRKNQKKRTRALAAKECSQKQKIRQFTIAQACACIDEYITGEANFYKVRDAIADVFVAYCLPYAYHSKMIGFNTVWIIAEMTYFNRKAKKMCRASPETLREIIARIEKEGAEKTNQKTETKKAVNTKNNPDSLKTEKNKQGGTKNQSDAEKEEGAGDGCGNILAEDDPLMRLYRERFEQTGEEEDSCEAPDIRWLINKIERTDRKLSLPMMRDTGELRLSAIRALCGERSIGDMKKQFGVYFERYIVQPSAYPTSRDIRAIFSSMVEILGEEELYKAFSETLRDIIRRAAEKEQRKNNY